MDGEDSMPRRVTSFDVARKAGVSRAAVSRAFTPDASVSAKTREKVFKAAKDLGYRVNYLARSLSNQRSDLVGLVAAGLDNPFRSLQLEHLSRKLVACNFRPILLPTSKEADTSAVIGQLLHYAVSGVVVTSDAPPSEICEQCAAAGAPIILINKGEELPFVDRVLSDDMMAGQIAADRLAASGARSLAVMAAPSVSYTARRRSEAFLSRCRRLGIAARLIEVSINDYSNGHKTAGALHELAIDGLFCVNDYMACGVIDHLLRDPGRAPKSRIRVIGHDDIPQAGWAAYELTTLRQPTDLQAEQAVDLLLSRIASPHLAARIVHTPVSLIERMTA